MSLRTHTRPGDEIVVEASAHIYIYEVACAPVHGFLARKKSVCGLRFTIWGLTACISIQLTICDSRSGFMAYHKSRPPLTSTSTRLPRRFRVEGLGFTIEGSGRTSGDTTPCVKSLRSSYTGVTRRGGLCSHLHLRGCLTSPITHTRASPKA